ncbi:MAG: hypothetical protein AAGB51_04030 [Planctomycetota bacterium]
MIDGPREGDPPGGRGFGRTVVLRHVLPDGSWHFDWLIEPPDGTSLDRLPTVRVLSHPEHTLGSFIGSRLADHRRAYLQYQGPVSGGRGEVERVGSGSCISFSWALWVCDWRGMVIEYRAEAHTGSDAAVGPSGGGEPLRITPRVIERR